MLPSFESYEEAVSALEASEAAGDHLAAAMAALALRIKYPSFADGYRQGVAALRALGAMDEAMAIASIGTLRHPDIYELWVERCVGASARGDLIQLAAVSAEMRTRFPNAADGYAQGCLALRQLGRFDEAAAVSQEAIARFPDQDWPHVDIGMVARARGDDGGAIAIADTIHERFPHSQGGHALKIVALRCMGRFPEALANAERAVELFPDAAWVHQEVGFIHRHQGSLLAAADVAARAAAQFPAETWPLRDQAAALQEGGRFEEAEAVLLAIGARHPEDRGTWEALARIENRRRRTAEADAYYETAIRIAPEDPHLALEYALRPGMYEEERHNGGESKVLERLERLHERFRDFEDAYAPHVEILARMGRASEIDDLLKRSGIDPTAQQRICDAWADAAIASGDFSEGVRRLELFRQKYPTVVDGLLKSAKMLARLGRSEEADALCQEAKDRFPLSRDIALTYALVAQLSGRNRLAISRWREGHEAFPDDIAFNAGAHEAELAAMDDAEDGGGSSVGGRLIVSASSVDVIAPQDLMMKFQNIGGPTHGCEFGSVQRHFGAEPLGLLRWVALTPDSMLDAMQDGFVALWDPSNIEVSLGAATPARPGDREYMLLFKKYDLHMHTWRYTSELSQEELLATFTKRLKFLARKFNEDLETGDTIFVYKQDLLEIDDADIISISRAFREHGGNTIILFVRQANDLHPEGTVHWLEEGLMVGYLDGFIISPAGYERPIRYDGWLHVCRSAYALTTNNSVSESPDTNVKIPA